MKGSAAKIQMASLDDLFGGAVAQAAGDQIQEILLTELYPFKDHPFHVVDDEKIRLSSVPGRRAAMRLWQATVASGLVSWLEKKPCRLSFGRWTMTRPLLSW